MMTNHGNRLTQGQFSFLPDLTDAQIRSQIEYALKARRGGEPLSSSVRLRACRWRTS